jgi:hypothetical protein
MSERATACVGFGRLERLVEDLRQDGVERVRVEDLDLCVGSGQYGVELHQVGVVVGAHVDGEVRYAWVVTGHRQMVAGEVLSGEEAHERTERAYREIVAWLEEQGCEVRGGNYALPTGVRLMRATAECLRANTQEDGGG